MYPSKISSGMTAALALLAATTLVHSVAAQDAAPPPGAATDVTGITTAPRNSILSVSMPDYARLRLDLDARDEDLLGVVKSFFRGFKGESLKELLNWMKAGGATAGTAPGAGNGISNGNALPGNLDRVAAVQLLSDADLGTMLRDINHVRIVVFEMPPPRRTSSGSGKPAAGKPAAGKPAKPQSVVAYYEQAYLVREGGRRIMRADFDEVQVLTVGFPNRGFAMVVQSPGMGVVVRSDGYLNFEGVGPFVMATLLRFAPPQRTPRHTGYDMDDD